jgi:import receptor subunit TOM22
MVKLEEVMDEEFVREQEGPHDEDEWDTDSGTPSLHKAKPALSYSEQRGAGSQNKHDANAAQSPTSNPNPPSSPTKRCTSASAH